MARRAALIDSLRGLNPNVLLVDAGDITHTSKTYDERYHRFIVEAMNRMGYDAMTPGELDLERGDDYVRDLLSRFKGKVVLSNVRPVSGATPWQETAIIQKGGKRIGIIGLISDNFGRGTEPITTAGWKVEDPNTALARVLPGLRKKTDIVVALAHLEASAAQKLAAEKSGIDLIVLGHMPGTPTPADPDSAAQTTVMRSGQRGEFLGQTTLVSAKKGEVTFDKPEAIMVDMAKIGEDVKLAKDLEDIKAAIDSDNRKAQLERELEANEGLVLGQDRFLGEETCTRCHSPMATELANGPHAHAFATLEKVGRSTDKSCLPCHVTGYGAAGGFEGKGASAEMKNVQCESCHGMGTTHDWTGAAKGAEEAVCLQCHVQEWSPKWDYHAYLKQLGHGSKVD